MSALPDLKNKDREKPEKGFVELTAMGKMAHKSNPPPPQNLRILKCGLHGTFLYSVLSHCWFEIEIEQGVSISHNDPTVIRLA